MGLYVHIPRMRDSWAAAPRGGCRPGPGHPKIVQMQGHRVERRGGQQIGVGKASDLPPGTGLKGVGLQRPRLCVPAGRARSNRSRARMPRIHGVRLGVGGRKAGRPGSPRSPPRTGLPAVRRAWGGYVQAWAASQWGCLGRLSARGGHRIRVTSPRGTARADGDSESSGRRTWRIVDAVACHRRRGAPKALGVRRHPPSTRRFPLTAYPANRPGSPFCVGSCQHRAGSGPRRKPRSSSNAWAAATCWNQ